MLRKGTRCHGTAIISRTCQRRAIPLHFEGERERKEKRDEINRISWLTVDLLSHARTPRDLLKRFLAQFTSLLAPYSFERHAMASSRQIYPLGDRPSHIRSITSTHPNPRHRPDTLHTHTRVERAHVYRIDAYTHTYVLRLQLIPKSFPSIQTLQCAWFTSYYEINYCLFRHIAPRSVKAGSRPCPRFPPCVSPSYHALST